MSYFAPGTNVTQTTPQPSASTVTNVAASVTVVDLLSLNLNRLGAQILNDSTSVLYVKLGSAASATSYTLAMAPGSYYELPSPAYTGLITGIWVSANGNARVTEAVV